MSLTDNDLKVLAAAWRCFESQPKINYGKLAEIMDYKNAASASASFLPIKKKLLASTPVDGNGTPAPATTPKKGKGKGKGKRKAEETVAEDDEHDEAEKVQTKRKKAKAAVEEDELVVKSEVEAGDED